MKPLITTKLVEIPIELHYAKNIDQGTLKPYLIFQFKIFTNELQAIQIMIMVQVFFYDLASFNRGKTRMVIKM